MKHPLLLVGLLALSSTLLLGAIPAPDVTTGKKLYTANCLVCHGATGNGKGPAGMALKPPPTDFTKASWWTGKTPDKVSISIRDGKPGTGMGAFPKLTDTDRANIVAYLQTLVVQ